MAPYSNLPSLLRPIHPPHRPDHHDHTGHTHPYPRPSLYITSVAMVLLSTYVLLLVGLAIFTMWRLSRKHSAMGTIAAATRNDTPLRFGGGAGGMRRAGWQQKGMVKSRVVVREVDGCGSGSGGASGGALPNTHLSHEDLDDTEETALLGGGEHENQSYGMTESREPENYHDDRREDGDDGIEADDELFTGEGGKRVVPRYGGQSNDGKSKGEGRTRFGIGNQSLREPAPKGKVDASNVKVPEGLQRAAEEGRDV